MPARTIIGVFDSTASAERACSALLRAGIPDERISVSVHLTEDGIAAEAPGQSYERQRFDHPQADTDWARYSSLLRTGTRVVSVAADSADDLARIEHLMRRSGARGTAKRPNGGIV